MSDDRRDGDVSRAEEDARARFRDSMTMTARDRLVKKPPPQSRRRIANRADDMPDRRRGSADFLETKAWLQNRLLEEIGEELDLGSSRAAVEKFVREFVDRVLESESITLNTQERDRLASELSEEAVGLGPLSALMADPAVTDVLVNGPNAVFVERFGRLSKTDVRFRDDDHVRSD